MGTRAAPTEADVIELVPVPIHFINGLHRLDHLGNGNVMFTYYRNEFLSDGHGQMVRSIELKLIIHVSDLAVCRRMTTAALSEDAVQHLHAPSMVM